MISLPWVSCWFIRVVVGDGNLEGWGLWVYFLTPGFDGVGVGKRVQWQSPVYHKEEMFGKEIAEFNVLDPKQGQEFSATYHKERHLKIATSHLVQQHLASCFRFVGVDPTRPSGDRRFLSHCNYPLILPNEKLGAWHGILNIQVFHLCYLCRFIGLSHNFLRPCKKPAHCQLSYLSYDLRLSKKLRDPDRVPVANLPAT